MTVLKNKQYIHTRSLCKNNHHSEGQVNSHPCFIVVGSFPVMSRLDVKFKSEVKGLNGFSVHTNDLLLMMIDTPPLISLSPFSAVSITNKK